MHCTHKYRIDRQKETHKNRMIITFKESMRILCCTTLRWVYLNHESEPFEKCLIPTLEEKPSSKNIINKNIKLLEKFQVYWKKTNKQTNKNFCNKKKSTFKAPTNHESCRNKMGIIQKTSWFYSFVLKGPSGHNIQY